MGVPKFFRWLYERYPCLCEVVREYEIPEFDNLYLDMNGIIHVCSHPNDFDPQFRITEESIFKNIFHYVEILFRMIQPQKLFFMAVDGVAPRAKLNQQRGRRFRTAKEAVDLEKKALESGAELPKEKRFDSNCITPGTEFMERLHHQLRYFIADKMTNDKLWKNVKVILSGHETPGEGEHKIMDYIRYMKAQPDYDHNTRHCLYGLDADLIMLGLCTHEPHFSLLREEVKYGKKASRVSLPEDTKYYLLHLSVMRGYLDWEFSSLRDKLPFGYNLENIIDDWVLMGFLVGNDFIPHLPGLHIAHGALQMLHKAYMDVLPTLDGYINEGGTLVLPRFQRYLEKLAAFDVHQFKDEFADLKYFNAKTGRRVGATKERPKFFNIPEAVLNNSRDNPSAPMDPNLLEMINYTERMEQELEELSLQREDKEEDLEVLFGGVEDDFHEDDDDDDEEEDDPSMFLEFCQKKRDYYTNKLEFEKVTPEVLQSQAEGYVRAIQWNLHYYYDGVCSWSWFYPHHYAPYISDIKNFCNVDLNFDLGKPFLPFQQLLAVLPSLSKSLLPEVFHSLMEDENSPILDYYPSTFLTDLNGKRQEWEAVVLIPFIDEVRLLAAMAPLEGMLTEEERRRNKHGPMSVYTYSGKSLGSFEAPYFPKIESNHALEKHVLRDELYVPQSQLVKGLCANVLLDVHVPGFPSLSHVPHKAYLEKAKVKVFDSPSHGESMMLDVQVDDIICWKKDTAVIAKELLGRTCHVSWPHLFETKVVEVVDERSTFRLVGQAKGQSTLEVQPTRPDRWRLEVQSIREEYATHLGVKLGAISVVLRALPMCGRKYAFSPNGNVSLQKQWSNQPLSFALQTAVKDIKVMQPKRVECQTIHEMFPPKTVVFLLGNPHYGSMGKVTDIVSASAGKVARVKIGVNIVPELDMEYIKAQVVHSGMKYYPGGVAAKRVGISAHLLSRVTGTLYVTQSQAHPGSKAINIGLSLKFNKRNEEVPGFTKKDSNGTWLYSDKCVQLLTNYIVAFPELFSYLSEHTDTNDFHEAAIFPEGIREGGRLQDVVEWLSQQPHAKVERRVCGTEVLEDHEVQAIEHEVDRCTDAIRKGRKTLTIMVQPHLIYKPGFKMGYMQPDETASYYVYDRVVNVRECFTVPLGLRGTVVGIRRASRPESTLYDVVFDSTFEGGVSLAGCSKGKGYRLPGYALVNLSHGIRCSKAGNSADMMVSSLVPSAPPKILSSGGGRSAGGITRHINNHSSSSPGGRQYAVPDRPASAFASWRSGCTGFAHPVQQQGGIKGGGEPPQVHSANSNCSLEFQAMWKELQKSTGGGGVKRGDPPSMLLVRDPGRPADPAIVDQQVKDSGTDFLKKILRIDGNSSSTSSVTSVPPPVVPPQKQVTSPLQEISQPSVQDFFERAKAAAVQGAQVQDRQATNQKSFNYCLQLISMYQRTGQGIPRYDYIMMDNGMVAANLSLPNGIILLGDPAPTNEKASENVAKLAIAQMNEWMTKGGGMMPASSKLPAPPQQWCQRPPLVPTTPYNPFSNQNWQHPAPANMYQKLNWREPPEQTGMEWRRRQNQWQNIRPPSQVGLFAPGAINPFSQHQPPLNSTHLRRPPPMQQSAPLRPPPHTANGSAPLQMANPFVPLQAVRAQKSMNSSSSFQGNQRSKQHSAEEDRGTGGVVERRREQQANEDGGERQVEGGRRKERDTKALYVPPNARKSRLAIKFAPNE
ncbi:5'-3' exoribonuclease 1 [Ischnura elegans]|uniref:5'-3' exoribonuclease 1 n=1 Tax=Ischnura elegans TaxID=197161 RepID=UPI001ED89AF5|nr:5'-3' exoribonuclease 1 [Ischnura elegans]